LGTESARIDSMRQSGAISSKSSVIVDKNEFPSPEAINNHVNKFFNP